MSFQVSLFRRLATRRAAGLISAFVGAATAGAIGMSDHTAHQEPAPKTASADVDCPTIACSSKKDALFAGMRGLGGGQKKGQGNKSNASSSSETPTEETQSINSIKQQQQNQEEEEEEEEDLGCPLDKEELGRAAWAFLHTTAAYMPEDPTEAQKKAALGLVDAVVELYPCGHCRSLFAKDVLINPPNVESGSAFAMWMCERHNEVNEWMGKPLFECSAKEIELRWTTGKQHCYED